MHVSHHNALLGRTPRSSSFVVTLGGDLVRLAPRSPTPARAATPSCSASTSPTPASTWSTACSSTTTARTASSRVAYKGALQGEGAHAVWIGDVLIRAEAEGTDTYEMNRNLVLTDGARVDSVPNLEILTGEIVGAGHASATGRFDDQHLFYLMARGIPADEARRLVVRGFFGELIHRSRCPSSRERLPRIEAELEESSLDDRSARCRDLPDERCHRLEVGASPVAVVAHRGERSSRCTTSARTPRCHCPRARSTTARWSAGCTGPASTCAPAAHRACRPPSPCPSTPSRSKATTSRLPHEGVMRTPWPPSRSATCTSAWRPTTPERSCGAST